MLDVFGSALLQCYAGKYFRYTFFIQGVSFRPEMGGREIDKTFNFRAKNRLKVIEIELEGDLQKERELRGILLEAEIERRKEKERWYKRES